MPIKKVFRLLAVHVALPSCAQVVLSDSSHCHIDLSIAIFLCHLGPVAAFVCLSVYLSVSLSILSVCSVGSVSIPDD